MNWLGESASAIAKKYALRASVVIPFVLAAGFAIAGLAVFLVELFGQRDAYFMLAGGFAVLGLITILVVRRREKRAEAETHEVAATSAMASTAVKVAANVPVALAKG
jgi:hypothetical protein